MLFKMYLLSSIIENNVEFVFYFWFIVQGKYLLTKNMI